MKVGDMIIRRVRDIPDVHMRAAVNQRELLGYGIILSKQMAGRPAHPCVSVYYPKTGKIYDIAESLVEVISESR